VVVIDPAETLQNVCGCEARLVALTAVEDHEFMNSLFEKGIAGYVCLRSPPLDIVRAIRAAAAGEVFVDSIMAAKLIHSAKGGRCENGLSGRELSVLKLVAWGLTDKEIAHNLGVGIKSINSYKRRAISKLGIRTRAEIVRMALERRWFSETADPGRKRMPHRSRS
jgi:DNA-binding NarL/FixJ family response regulator